MRGKVEPERLRKLSGGITPAWAGKRPTRTAALATTGDHPRMGGEKSRLQSLAERRVGSPPRGRGKATSETMLAGEKGITPAWAGKRRPQSPLSAGRWDHPRVGGEKMGCSAEKRSRLGSPPHGRGKGHACHQAAVVVGITPAWAGKRQRPAIGRTWQGDHPRVGGEKLRGWGLE